MQLLSNSKFYQNKRTFGLAVPRFHNMVGGDDPVKFQGVISASGTVPIVGAATANTASVWREGGM